MAHKHSVYDTDTHFIIDGETRAVKNANATKAMLVQGDHNSERFTFELPRFIDGHDMSLCDSIEVHYINISKTGEENPGVYNVEDLQVSKTDGNVVEGSWLISGNATKFAGTLVFLLRFACSSEESTDYVWNTARNEKVYVTDGLYNGEYIAEEYADILAQWEARISNMEKGNVSDERIAEAVADYMAENPVSPGATAEEVAQIHANAAAIAEMKQPVTQIDFSNFENGSFTETINGEVITHSVTFDSQGRPVKIDDTTIVWGDSE